MRKAVTKGSWTRVAFGDVVRLTRERSSDPATDGFERYVGLEHLEQGDLEIRRWGDISDGTTFTNIFRSGQVLFGKRRAYQRKIAFADFTGVCSGDIYVIEPKGELLLPELLPFVCQSEGFFEHAIGTSAGSLSPRTNWDSLSRYEFDLPPVQEQERFARALWAAESLRRNARRLAESCAVTRMALAASLFAEMRTRVGVYRLSEAIVDSAYGPRFPGDNYVADGNVFTIRTTDFLSDGSIDYSTVPAAQLSKDVVDDHRLIDGDFLLSRSGEYAGMVRVFDASVAPPKLYIPAAFLIRFRLDLQRLIPRFLQEYFESRAGTTQLKRLTQGSAQPNISGSAFMNLSIPIPSLSEQKAVCEQLQNVRNAQSGLSSRELESKRLVSTLTELLLTGHVL